MDSQIRYTSKLYIHLYTDLYYVYVRLSMASVCPPNISFKDQYNATLYIKNAG